MATRGTCHTPSRFLSRSSQLSRRFSAALAEPAKTKHVGYLVRSLTRLTHSTGATAMQCALMKKAFEFPMRHMNTGDFNYIDHSVILIIQCVASTPVFS